METVDVKLPSELLKAANLEESSLSQEAARLLALELYREDKVSLGRAAQLCHTPLPAFMDFAAKHGIHPQRFNIDEMEQDSKLAKCEKQLQDDGIDGDFHPVDIAGEPLSETILRDRR